MVEFPDIQAAYDRIKSAVNHTPIMTSRTLNHILHAEVYFKCENFQRVGAFKFRGAINAVMMLSDDQKKRGVITHSSGNHAQALALAAKLAGIKAVIVMPQGSPQVKINATRETYDAEVVICENTLQARHDTCEKLIRDHGYTLIHPYDNENVIAGAGTACYELLHEVKDLDLVIAPVGGGGLLSGTALAAKGINSKIKVFGAEPKLVDDAARSIQLGKIQHNSQINTIADGLRTDLCERTFNIIQRNVDQILTVTESKIIDAMRFLWERMKLVVEPSGAVSLAAIMSNPTLISGKRIGVIISGGNVDVEVFFTTLQQKIVNN